MKRMRKMLMGLDVNELRELLESTVLITDKLGQDLINTLNLRDIVLGTWFETEQGLRDTSLVRLYKLVDLGVINSSLEPIENRTSRVFSITDLGRRIGKIFNPEEEE